MAIGYAQGENSQTSALKAALASPSLEKYLGKAPMAYSILKTSPDLRLIDIYESLDILRKTVDRDLKHAPGYQWVLGALTDPNLDHTTKAIVIMSSIREAVTSAKAFQNIGTCDTCSYSVHTGFVEIQKQGFEVVYYCPTCDKTIAFITREELDTQKPLECLHCKNTNTLLCQQGNTGISCPRCGKGTFIGEEVLIKW
jgi:DNA-directed RNA polymerase subunit RPC12/RpoP